MGSGTAVGSVWICSRALTAGAARPQPSPLSVPAKPTLTGIATLPADRSAVSLNVAGAERAIGRSETGMRSVVAPLVSVTAP